MLSDRKTQSGRQPFRSGTDECGEPKLLRWTEKKRGAGRV